MGCYINPKDQTKEEWLQENAIELEVEDIPGAFEFNEAVLPVVLLDNGNFTAAGVCYSKQEFEDFKETEFDKRPRRWFIVLIEKLREVSDLDRWIEKEEFVDAQQIALDNPDTFEVPDITELRTLQLPVMFKVCHSEERFWTEATDITGDKVTATVKNLLISAPFKFEQVINFELRHVYSWKQEMERTNCEETNIQALHNTYN